MIKMLTTIGPSCDRIDDIRFLTEKTNLLRLNGSHNTIEWHHKTIEKIRSVAPDSFILLDIPGIKPRTANSEPIEISKGDVISFGREHVEGAIKHVGLTKNLPMMEDAVRLFSVNDGQFVFDVIQNNQHSVSGRSREAFTLIQKKGLNVPESVYEENLQKRIYLDFIKTVAHMDINGVGLSFVQTGKLVAEIREVVPHLVLVSKIENSEGYKNKANIIHESDAVMIDRGDLAAEIGLLNLFDAVEDISLETKSYGKPLIMATENLETMTTRLEPSKSEVMSLGHSAVLGADCIMLSEETAISCNFVNTVNWLEGFLAKEITKLKAKPKLNANLTFPNLWRSVQNLPGIPVALFTRSGRALSELVSTCSKRRVIVVTNNKKVTEIAKLHDNDFQVIFEEMEDTIPSELVYKITKQYKSQIFSDDPEIVAVYVSKQFSGARANNLTFLTAEMFVN